MSFTKFTLNVVCMNNNSHSVNAYDTFDVFHSSRVQLTDVFLSCLIAGIWGYY